MKGIHGALLNLLGAMDRMKVRGMPRALVIVLMLLIIGSIFLYWAGWIWLWTAEKRVDLQALNALIQTITSMAFIAAVGFIGRSLIDADGDGVPDPWKKEIDAEDEKSETGRHPNAG
ncbi:hypothetical protein [Acidaminococcus intestini]|uniref:hypothetical protein n=1 Tax=Acidaminococcus intestini TaxID=187327 RepID=UPI003AB88819